jgi:hypothetical protein
MKKVHDQKGEEMVMPVATVADDEQESEGISMRTPHSAIVCPVWMRRPFFPSCLSKGSRQKRK